MYIASPCQLDSAYYMYVCNRMEELDEPFEFLVAENPSFIVY